jgi:hypothetical protein
MRPTQSGSILNSILGIIVCGAAGGFTAWYVVMQLGWQGLVGALVAAVIGMVVATGAWTALTWLLHRLRGMR